METTIDIPDELHRHVMARSAVLGRTLREVTIELYHRWLGELPTSAPRLSAAEWLDEWVALGRAAVGRDVDGRAASETLASDRRRLERS